MMDFAAYRKIDAVNWSTLKHMAESPLHYRHRLSVEVEETDAMRFGSAAHCAVLEPAEYARRYVVWTGGVRRGKEWDAFCAGHADRTIITERDHDRVHALAEAVRSHPVMAPYMVGRRQAERVIQWTDAETGVPCKARLDLLVMTVGRRRVLSDFKTARSIEARLFGQASARLGYHCQLAFYADGLAAIGEPVDEVTILAAESAAPHDGAVYVLDDDVLHTGRETFRDLLRRLVACRERDEWPGRFTAPQALELPAWLFDDGNEVNKLGLDLGGLDDEC